MSAVVTDAPTFNPADAKTWPVLLTPEHIAAIWGLSVDRVNRLVCIGQFKPMPKDLSKPRRWRRADVLRETQGRTA